VNSRGLWTKVSERHGGACLLLFLIGVLPIFAAASTWYGEGWPGNGNRASEGSRRLFMSNTEESIV
jgi:hypothetical protein